MSVCQVVFKFTSNRFEVSFKSIFELISILFYADFGRFRPISSSSDSEGGSGISSWKVGWSRMHANWAPSFLDRYLTLLFPFQQGACFTGKWFFSKCPVPAVQCTDLRLLIVSPMGHEKSPSHGFWKRYTEEDQRTFPQQCSLSSQQAIIS